MAKVVAIVGTLDTKGAEYEFIKEQIESHGVQTLVINTGFMAEPPFVPEVSARERRLNSGSQSPASWSGKRRRKN